MRYIGMHIAVLLGGVTFEVGTGNVVVSIRGTIRSALTDALFWLCFLGRALVAFFGGIFSCWSMTFGRWSWSWAVAMPWRYWRYWRIYVEIWRIDWKGRLKKKSTDRSSLVNGTKVHANMATNNEIRLNQTCESAVRRVDSIEHCCKQTFTLQTITHRVGVLQY